MSPDARPRSATLMRRFDTGSEWNVGNRRRDLFQGRRTQRRLAGAESVHRTRKFRPEAAPYRLEPDALKKSINRSAQHKRNGWDFSMFG